MIASAHFAAGIIIGIASDRVVRGRIARVSVAFGAAIVMHFMMDAIPHTDYHFFPPASVPVLVVGETLMVAVIAGWLLRSRLTPHWRECVAAGLIGSALPDVKFIAPYLLSPYNAILVEYYGNKLHRPFHASADYTAFGMATQVICAILLLAMLAAFPRTRAASG